MLRIIRFRHTTHHMWQHRSGLAMLAFWTIRLRPVVPKALFKAFRKVVLAGAASDRKSVRAPQFWSVPAEGWYPWRSKLLVRIMRQRMDFEDLFIYDIWTRVLHEGWMTYRCWPRQAQRMLRWNGSKRLCQKVYIIWCVYGHSDLSVFERLPPFLSSNLSNRYEQHACHRCHFWCFSMFRRPLPSGSI